MRKNWKMILLAAVVFTAMCISDGCGGETPKEEAAPQDFDAAGKENAAAQADVPKENEQPADGTDTETFCGDVERIDGDSAICSEIETYKTEDGQGEVAVSSAAAEDRELVAVRFAQDAVYSYQIIRDGGADVETREGSFADIRAGLILDLTGHYDGDVFLADTVRISDVRTD